MGPESTLTSRAQIAGCRASRCALAAGTLSLALVSFGACGAARAAPTGEASGTGQATAAAGSQVGAGQPGEPGPAGPIALRGGVYMLTVQGVNVALQSGPQGTIVVDTGPAAAASELLAQILKVSQRPIRYIIDTGADAELIGGNAAVAAL